jgi:hypothetical protein
VGGLAFLIAYTVLIGIAELQFHITVGQVLSRLIHWLADG